MPVQGPETAQGATSTCRDFAQAEGLRVNIAKERAIALGSDLRIAYIPN
jgi:hypothetical protein